MVKDTKNSIMFYIFIICTLTASNFATQLTPLHTIARLCTSSFLRTPVIVFCSRSRKRSSSSTSTFTFLRFLTQIHQITPFNSLFPLIYFPYPHSQRPPQPTHLSIQIPAPEPTAFNLIIIPHRTYLILNKPMIYIRLISITIKNNH